MKISFERKATCFPQWDTWTVSSKKLESDRRVLTNTGTILRDQSRIREDRRASPTGNDGTDAKSWDNDDDDDEDEQLYNT